MSKRYYTDAVLLLLMLPFIMVASPFMCLYFFVLGICECLKGGEK